MKQPRRSTLFAKKSFGQNFLVDRIYIDRIIEAVGPESGDTIFEIGPGRGAITERLVNAEANVIAIELDRDMISLLERHFARESNFRLIEADAVKINFRETAARFDAELPAKLVANLPYNVSTAILQRLTAERECFSEMVLMFQREVAARIAASPATPERGFLSVLAQAFLDVKILFDVPPDAFRPAPKIWSTVVRVVPKVSSQIDFDSLHYLASQAFSQRRKTITNNLKAAFPDVESALVAVGIDPRRRAETLSNDEWEMLCQRLFVLPDRRR